MNCVCAYIYTLTSVLLFTACSGQQKPELENESNKANNVFVDPPHVAPPPKTKPTNAALNRFLEAAKGMGLSYADPAGYSTTPIVENMDVSYDYAVLSDDKRIEMRFALRPYGKDMPEPMRTMQFSWPFFQTGIFNLIHGGKTGKSAPAELVPAEHFGADDAKLVMVRWFDENNVPKFFGNGYELAAVIFIHRDDIGDAYTFILLKDREAMELMNESLMHTLRFAPTPTPQ